jgi:hypothetical protein
VGVVSGAPLALCCRLPVGQAGLQQQGVHDLLLLLYAVRVKYDRTRGSSGYPRRVTGCIAPVPPLLPMPPLLGPGPPK